MKIFEPFIGAFQAGGALLLSPLLRGWYNRWGASQAELLRPLPGDDLVPDPQLGYTRAVQIQAPPERIWPWLAQLGQGRGGLYSYDALENLVGCQIHSADRILPEYQDLKVGDVIRLGPKGYPCFGVASVDPPRALVLISLDPKTEQPVSFSSHPGKGFSITTWQFYLETAGEDLTHLLVRQRLAYSPDLAPVWRITEPIAFVMERKMLLGIRQRAEQIP